MFNKVNCTTKASYSLPWSLLLRRILCLQSRVLSGCNYQFSNMASKRHGALEETVWREFRGRSPGLAAEAKKRLNPGLPTDQLVADAPCDGTKFATGIRSCLFCEINLPNWEICRMLAVNIPGWFLPDCCGCGCVLLCNGRRVSVVGSRN